MASEGSHPPMSRDRVRAHRDAQTALHRKRLDVHVSESVREDIRKFAKECDYSTGDAVERLLVDGLTLRALMSPSRDFLHWVELWEMARPFFEERFRKPGDHGGGVSEGPREVTESLSTSWFSVVDRWSRIRILRSQIVGADIRVPVG